jgi:hypothetical protein
MNRKYLQSCHSDGYFACMDCQARFGDALKSPISIGLRNGNRNIGLLSPRRYRMHPPSAIDLYLSSAGGGRISHGRQINTVTMVLSGSQMVRL